MILHGLYQDLRTVYGSILHILPAYPDESVYIRTSGDLTDQVASGLVAGLWNGNVSKYATHAEPSQIDGLAPSYTCAYAKELQSEAQSLEAWYQHLNASLPLQQKLDSILNTTDDSAWHVSWDHFYDSFSARLCNGHPLPCQYGNKNNCVSMEMADGAFRVMSLRTLLTI